MEETKQTKKLDAKLLLFTTLLISICSIIYELIISSLSSYLQGDSITQFSITIGLYMCAMGIGSYLSKYIKEYKCYHTLVKSPEILSPIQPCETHTRLRAVSQTGYHILPGPFG